jgi:hypothetical protein
MRIIIIEDATEIALGMLIRQVPVGTAVISPDALPGAQLPVASQPVQSASAADDADARVEEGARAFGELVRIWSQNFGVEGAEQPDRGAALMGCVNGYGRQITAYIRERGGLAGAIIDCLLRMNLCAPENANRFGKTIAYNMVQVGSVLTVPFEGLLERSLVTRDMPDDTPPRGGISGDQIDSITERPKGW